MLGRTVEHAPDDIGKAAMLGFRKLMSGSKVADRKAYEPRTGGRFRSCRSQSILIASFVIEGYAVDAFTSRSSSPPLAEIDSCEDD